ncbi:MAG: hypothetical protein RJA36_2751 [Pseudomonadota bacterium]
MKLELRSRWSRFLEQRTPRERLALQLAVSLLALLLLWSLAVAPAWRMLRSAPIRQAALQPQLHAMRAMATEAQALRQGENAQPPARAQRLRSLESSTRRLLGSSTQLQAAGEQATVTLRDASPKALAQWLQEARVNARMRPVQVQLERVGEPARPRWQGTVVLGDAAGEGA